jgi:hypothetical protein
VSPEMVTALSALGVASVTAAGGIVTAVVGRRQPRGQQRRDDFAAVTARLDKDIERLERRVDEQEEEGRELRVRITTQDFTIQYLLRWTRSLVGYVRRSGLEPPAPPQPVPPDVEPYLSDLGV